MFFCMFYCVVVTHLEMILPSNYFFLFGGRGPFLTSINEIAISKPLNLQKTKKKNKKKTIYKKIIITIIIIKIIDNNNNNRYFAKSKRGRVTFPKYQGWAEVSADAKDLIKKVPSPPSLSFPPSFSFSPQNSSTHFPSPFPPPLPPPSPSPSSLLPFSTFPSPSLPLSLPLSPSSSFTLAYGAQPQKKIICHSSEKTCLV